jgi:hypothetical protein
MALPFLTSPAEPLLYEATRDERMLRLISECPGTNDITYLILEPGVDPNFWRVESYDENPIGLTEGKDFDRFSVLSTDELKQVIEGFIARWADWKLSHPRIG